MSNDMKERQRLYEELGQALLGMPKKFRQATIQAFTRSHEVDDELLNELMPSPKQKKKHKTKRSE